MYGARLRYCYTTLIVLDFKFYSSSNENPVYVKVRVEAFGTSELCRILREECHMAEAYCAYSRARSEAKTEEVYKFHMNR